MNNYDFLEKFRTLNKEIKISWEELLVKYQKEGKDAKEDVRAFKSNILIPTLDKVTDLTALIIEQGRDDLYREVSNFLKNIIDLSTVYRRQQGTSISFNFSSETEHLSILLPAYEATVRMHIIGSIAVAENAYNFISILGDQEVISHIDENGRKVSLSIFYFPWYTDGYGAGNLHTFFEDAKKRLSEDQVIKERYFSLLKDTYINALCEFDFLQCVKLEILDQNNNDLGYPRFPNFARYRFDRVEDIIEKFIKQESDLKNTFPISKNDFKCFLLKYVNYVQNKYASFGHYWNLSLLPEWFKEYLF